MKFNESKLAHQYLDGLVGIEIGASAHNPFGLDTRNVDYTKEMDVFKQGQIDLCGECSEVDIVSPGDDLPLGDEEVDFVISSHAVEHFFNPIKAIKEWFRVSKQYVFIIAPHKDRTFDKERTLTTPAELRLRYEGELTPEQVNSPESPYFNGETDPYGHWNVWNTETFLELCEQEGWHVADVQDSDDKVGNGFTVVLSKRKEKTLSLKSDLPTPYYILAPDYSEGSAGVMALHMLCHSLNLSGQEAYVTSDFFDLDSPILSLGSEESPKTRIKISDRLRTPVLSSEIINKHKVQNFKPIIIYPETVADNPLNGELVVRYILNKPGYLGGDNSYADNEMLFAYKGEFLPSDMQAKILCLPTSDLELFNLHGEEKIRKGTYVFANRYLQNGGELLESTKDAELLSFENKKSLSELADIFKHAELLYSYEGSAICTEAMLCGCPVVYIPNEQMKSIPAFELFGDNGAAWGVAEEQIQHAKNTVKNIYLLYKKLGKTFWEQLSVFIYDTQLNARRQPAVSYQLSESEISRSVSMFQLPPKSQTRLKVGILTADLVGHACLSIRLENVLAQLHAECEYRFILKTSSAREKEEVFVDEDVIAWADLVIIQRSAAQAKNVEVVEKIFASKCPVVYETDDLLSEPLPNTNVLHHSFKAHIPYIREVVRKADLITVSTPYLKQKMVELNKNITVLPNLIDSRVWKKVKPQSQSEKLKVLYAGTVTHIADLKMIENALLQLHDKYEDKIELIFAGCVTERLSDISTLALDKSVSYEEYAQIVQEIEADIAIAPLVDEEFNHSKSNIKWLEYSMSGCAGVYSDVEAYSMIDNGETGLLAKTEQEWFLALERLILDKNERAKIAVQAQNKVIKDYTLQGGSKSYLQAWKLLLDIPAYSERVSLELPQKYEEGYQAWSERRRLMPAQTQFLAERTAFWTHSPTFHITILINENELGLLSKTLDSLDSQLYSAWGLTLVSHQAKPAIFEDVPQNIEWIELQENKSVQSTMLDVVTESETDWVIQMNPGDTFEYHTLLRVSDVINENPEAVFVYCDEDIDDSGFRSKPKLKTDFNLHLLRSMSYVGNSCFVRRNELISLGGYSPLAYVHNTDICLKIFEEFGHKAIIHIDDVLYHSTKHNLNKSLMKENEITTRYDHLQRSNLSGLILPLNSDARFDIKYVHEKNALVSIVLANDGHVNDLAYCLNTILDITDYENFEVIIIDNNSEDEDFIYFYDDIKSRLRGKVRVVASTSNNYSTVVNQAVSIANGEYICVFSITAIPAHKTWLKELMALVQLPDVAIVGPKVIDDEGKNISAGCALGKTNDIEGLYLGAPMEAQGYLSRATVTQNYSSVSSAAFVINKEVFNNIGGMDEVDFANTRFCVMDLCLKAQQGNHLVVWVPTSVVKQNLEFIKRTNGVSTYTELPPSTLLAKWGKEFKRDENYNRHLTLNSFDSSLETEVIPEWDGIHHSRPQVMAFPFNSIGNGEYRVRAPLRALAHDAVIEVALLPNHDYISNEDRRALNLFEIHRAMPDVLFLQSTLSDHDYEFLTMIKSNTNIVTVFGIDDLVDQVPEKSSRRTVVYRDMRPRLRRTLSLCDRAVVTTQPIADSYAEFHNDIVVIPICLEQLRWNNIIPTTVINNKRPRVGWAGAQQHYGDLEILFEVVKETATEVDWIFFGMCPEEIQPYAKEVYDYIAFDKYPQQLANLNLDIAVAPLEINNFNIAKSNLRLLEYGMMGWPVVCTDIEPYQLNSPPVTRISNDKASWVGAIRESLANPLEMKQQGKALKQWVTANYILEDNLTVWSEVLTP